MYPPGIWVQMYPKKKDARTIPCCAEVHSNSVFIFKIATDKFTRMAYTIKNPQKASPANSCRFPNFCDSFWNNMALSVCIPAINGSDSAGTPMMLADYVKIFGFCWYCSTAVLQAIRNPRTEKWILSIFTWLLVAETAYSFHMVQVISTLHQNTFSSTTSNTSMLRRWEPAAVCLNFSRKACFVRTSHMMLIVTSGCSIHIKSKKIWKIVVFY